MTTHFFGDAAVLQSLLDRGEFCLDAAPFVVPAPTPELFVSAPDSTGWGLPRTSSRS